MRVPGVIMRGGTSKAVFFHERDLPADPAERDRFILAAYGSPDPYRRQIDGLGGATSTTSKVAVISDGRDRGVDVLYDFGQVSIDSALVDRRGNCGNISSAVGPFAVDEGLVEATDPVTIVRFLNTNTNKVIVAHVPTRDGRFHPVGDFELPGVPGTGARIQLDYVEPGGSVTGKLLPTGNVRDELEVPGLGTVEVSLVDAANPLVFVRWEALGLTGQENPEEIDADPALLGRIESVRAHAAVLSGITETPEEATHEVPSVPKLAFVGPPQDYLLSNGSPQSGEGTSLRAAMMSMGRVHRSYALTGGICTAVAAGLPGTLVNEVAGERSVPCLIGHPAGVLELSADVARQPDGTFSVPSVAGYRTARRLMEGTVLVPDELVR
ncbi:2-methylaconitate cis-trans isomerase PrpF family protein [Georgenia subflava]|uniref:2-methylaconitate cis-trans isomerase PrpF family protein n=1 Tax=Georgenia subflava TaxID=1622177 RepID=UPI001D031B64|nr:PrpF domain-containing protein [Georgenia subflava]